MVLGALLDLGLPLDELRQALGSLAIDVGTIGAERVLRAGISATKFRVVEHTGAGGQDRDARHSHSQSHAHSHGHGHTHNHSHAHAHAHEPEDEHEREDPESGAGRGQPHAPADDHAHDHAHQHASRAGGHGHHSLAEIHKSIDRSALSPDGRARAQELFQRLAEAEAGIHGMPLERVHLHEVGAVDSIIDIVGAVFGMEWLGATRVVSSPVNVGGGTVRCAHGVFPVPAPATARLLRGVPIYAGDVRKELTTPTGALLVTAYADSFGPLPQMRVNGIGYGAGDRDFPQHPNVLRLIEGDEAADAGSEAIVMIESEIDDMNPQLFGPLMDRLYATGALDVYYAAVQMKKNRPGTLVTVLAPPDRRDALSGVLFTETTTIGVRYHEVRRERLEREVITIGTAVGPVRFKVARRHGRVMNASPEFDDCARAAADRSLPIKEVQALAMKAWLDRAQA